MAVWTFPAEYDPEVHVWWTANFRLGITTEADSIEGLAAKLEVMIPEMVEENAEHLSEEERREPHEFRLIAHHEMQRRAAAWWSTASVNGSEPYYASMAGSRFVMEKATTKSGGNLAPGGV